MRHFLSTQRSIKLGRTSQDPNGPIHVHLLPPDLIHSVAFKLVKDMSRCFLRVLL